MKAIKDTTPLYFEGLRDRLEPKEAELLRRAEESVAPAPHFFDFLTSLKLDYSSEIAIIVIPEGSTEVVGVGRLVIVRPSLWQQI